MVDDKTVFVLIIMKLTYVLGYHDQGIFYLHQPFCNRSGADLIPKSDCTGFYICSDGLTYEETCQDGWVFSHGAHGCVPRGSFIDDCDTVAEKCARDIGGIFPHELECQLYYNCSNNNTVRFTEPFLQECPYPQLFNAQTLECDDFVDVSCRMRNEIVTKCKYWTYKSSYGSHSIPCSVSNPSCEGLPDGENPNRGLSPYYITCFKGRTIDSGYCPSLNVSDMPSVQLFHPELRMCVPLYWIPRERGGIMPDCSTQPDGSYPVDPEHATCRYYFICANGELDDVYSCPDEMLFDAILRECMDQSTVRCA